MSETWGDLEIFTKSGSRSGGSFVSISPKKTIVFNVGFIKEAKLENYDFVVLYYSKAKNAIVFRFTKNAEKGALKISKSINASISARSFFNYYNFNEEVKGRYRPKKEEIKDIGPVWVIYLSEASDS